jgi:lauroyl/myristoyl acyltransferase
LFQISDWTASPIAPADRFDAQERVSYAPPVSRLPLFTFKDALWFLYLYPLRFLSAFVPVRLLYPLGSLAQLCAPWRTNQAERRILSARCPSIPPGRARRIAARFLANSAFRMLDDLALSWPTSRRSLKCAGIQGLENLERARSAGQGVILLAAHFCAGRVAKRYLASSGYPILTVRDQFEAGDWWGRWGWRYLAPRRLEFLNRVMERGIYVRDPGCSLKILHILRSGGLVDVHFDARSGARNTAWPFLGVSRQFSTGTLDLVRHSGCAVVPMLCLGRGSSFRVIFDPMLEIVSAEGRDEFIRANLHAFVQTIERRISGHPEDWEQWMSF